MRFISLSVTFVSVLLAVGCKEKGAGTGTSPSAPADPWIRHTPGAFFSSTANLIDLRPDQFALVSHNEDQAIAALAGSPWVKVTPDEAKAYTGRSFSEPGGELVLLRALALTDANGTFSVTWRAGEVRVHFGDLGDKSTSLTRRAIVARLPAVPAEVFVDCSTVR